MYLIRKGQIIPVHPKGFGGGVTIYVRAPSVGQYREIAMLPSFPITEEERKLYIEVMGRHLDNIIGLNLETAAGGSRELKSIADVVECCPPWVCKELYRAVAEASTLPPETMGNSEPPSSGAGRAAGTTAPIVDPEEQTG